MKKRILSIVLALCLVFSLLPVSALADEAPTSGTCGKNLTWSLDSNGTLTISGTGKMKDYSMSQNDEGINVTTAPWGVYYKSIKSVVLENSVTSIGEWAFSDCSSLTSIMIPDSVTTIGSWAFRDCSGLTTIMIPDGVTSIGGSVFSGCSSLTNVTIPDSVTNIGRSAFYGCSSLTSITIPDSVTSIGSSAFSGCSSLTSVTIGNGVTSIGESAFNGCSSLTSVKISDGVTSIGSSAFSRCRSLTSVKIPDGVTSIGSSTFYNCSSLTSVTIPDSVTSIGTQAFLTCYSLTSVSIPDSVTSIGAYAFTGCSKLKDAAFGGSKTAWQAIGYTISDYVRMHYNCASLEGHYVPMEVKESSCTSTGYTKYGCTCGFEYIEEIPENHNFVYSKTVAPTCGEHGYDLLVCSKCGKTTKQIHDDQLLEHSYQVTVVEPSCLTGGYTLHKCSVCGNSYKDELVQPIGHSEVSAEAKAPTCTEAGHTAGTCCSRCGKAMSGMEEIAALGHNFGAWTQTKAPTCTASGTELRTCTRCNATETREIAATGHHYADTVTAPTCTAKGYTTHTCACGNSYVDNYTNALGHSYKNGVCTRCNAKDPNYVAAPVVKITTSAGKPKISWSKVDGATKYYIYRSTDGKNYKQYNTTTKTSYTNTGTTIGTTYYYKVKAAKVVNDKTVYSAYSNVKSIKCTPAAPVVSISRSSGKAKLSWNAVSGATKYWIYRSTDGKNYKYYTYTTKLSYTDSKSASGTKYYYKVKAVAVVNGTNVGSCYSTAKSFMTTLAKPTVKITTANGKPKLSWNKVTGADKYIVYRSTDGKTFKQLSTTTKTSLTNTGAKKNTKYYYKVKAICSANTNANSAYSNVVSIKATK